MCGYGFHVATRRGVGNITPPHGVLGMESVEKGKVQEISISKVFGDLDAMLVDYGSVRAVHRYGRWMDALRRTPRRRRWRMP